MLLLIKVVKLIFILIIVFILAGILFVFFAFDSSHDEVFRVASPNAKLEAVLYESNGGATTSFGYEVYIVEKNISIKNSEPVANLYGAVRNKSAYGVNLVWKGSNTLIVEYLNAKNANLISNKINISSGIVEIELKSGVNDAKALSGGMLYNIENNKITVSK
jgi:hypothetical protein